MNDVLFSPLRLSELENLIEKSVRRAMATTEITHSETDLYGDFKWLQVICVGIPASTLRIKSAAGDIPGVVKIGKRVLYNKAAVLAWLKAQTCAQPDTAEAERVNEAQFNQRIGRKDSLNRGEK